MGVIISRKHLHDNNNSDSTTYCCTTCLVDPLIKEDLTNLISNDSSTMSYASYVKSGVWIDKLNRYDNNEKVISHNYNMDKYDMPSMALLDLTVSVSDTLYSRRSFNVSDQSNNSPTARLFEELYTNIDSDSIFDRDTMVLLLLAILYPSYRKSCDYRKFELQQQGILSIFSSLSGLSYSSMNTDTFLKDDELLTGGVERVHNLLVSTAALIDVDELTTVVKNLNNGLTRLSEKVDDLPIAFAICHVNRENDILSFPTVLLNKAFNRRTNVGSDKVLLGCDIRSLISTHSLTGESTHPFTLERALFDGVPIKYGTQLFDSSGMPFMNLLSVQPVYDQNNSYEYAIVALIDPHKEKAVLSKQLSAVDDLLLLLPRLLIRPR